MDKAITKDRGETDAHRRLKRLAILWAQGNGYSACGTEVSLPKCRYRADVAAYRSRSKQPSVAAVFECKQSRADLRRDNCRSASTHERLRLISQRREALEKRLRTHYPTLRTGDSLFPEYDSHDFSGIGHRGYGRIVRELATLQARLTNSVKFDCLVRYRCANLFFLVLPGELYCEWEIPPGWGALVEENGALSLKRRPFWHDISPETSLRFLQRIAIAGTRHCNRQLGILFEEIQAARHNQSGAG